MAEIVCTKFEIPSPLEGGEIKKLLWENPTPTTARGAFDATLSESINDYDYFEIEYAYAYNNSAIKTTIRTPVFFEDGTSYVYPSTKTNLRGTLGQYNAKNETWTRRYYIKDSTTITFSTGTIVGANTSSGNVCIPLAIYGIKTNSDEYDSAQIIAVGGVSNTTSPLNMNIPIPEDVKSGFVVLSYTRDSNQPVSSVSITSGTAAVEREALGKYQYTNAYLNTYVIRISNVSADSVLTCLRSTTSANFFTYVVYKFS